jgi:hypothetical protein
MRLVSAPCASAGSTVEARSHVGGATPGRGARIRRAGAGTRWALAAGLAGVGLCVPRQALAQDAGVQGVISVAIGYSDNILSAPDAPVPGRPGPQGSAFGEVSPGVVFYYETPRVSHALRYTFSATAAFQADAADSLANNLAYSGRFETTERTELLLGLVATHGRVLAISGAQSAAVTPVEAAPPGATTQYYVQGGGTEALSFEVSENVRFEQGLSGQAYIPVEEDAGRPRVYNAGLSLGVERSWRDDSLGLTVSTAYTQFAEHTVGTALVFARHELVNIVAGTWDHDYSDHWSSQLTLGALQAMRATDGGGQLYQPTGRAGILYTREEGQAELAFSHTVQPNVQIGTMVLQDELTLRAAVPIAASDSDALSLEAVGGLEQARALDERGDLADPLTVVVADAALTYTPLDLPVDLDLSIRYQLARQTADDVLQQFTRHTALLSLSLTVPTRDMPGPALVRPYRRPPPEAPPRPPTNSGTGKPPPAPK